MSSQTCRRWLTPALICVGLALAACSQEAGESGEPDMTIENGVQVSLEYTLKLDDETVVDSNVGEEPWTYTQGAGEMIPGVEKGVVGMTIGEAKEITVSPEDGFGEVIPDAIREVPKTEIPEGAMQLGAELQGQGPGGEVIRARVTEIRDETVMVDFNHPLAGQTLHFTVKVVDAQQGSTLITPAAE